MTLHMRCALPNYPYVKGEQIRFVVNPFWEQLGLSRQVQIGEVHSHFLESVVIKPIGEPWDEPVLRRTDVG